MGLTIKDIENTVDIYNLLDEKGNVLLIVYVPKGVKPEEFDPKISDDLYEGEWIIIEDLAGTIHLISSDLSVKVADIIDDYVVEFFGDVEDFGDLEKHLNN